MPTAGGTFNFTVQVQDSSSPAQTDSQAYTVLILEITTIGLQDGVRTQSYSDSFSVIGEVGATTWSEPTTFFDDTTGIGTPGTACEGLAFDFAAGSITATPTMTGTCGPFTVQVTDSDTPARTHSQNLSIRVADVLQIITNSLPGGTTGASYNATLSATGGIPPYNWSETTNLFDDTTGQGATGTACEGLRLDFSGGAITGTPANPGTCGPFTLRVEDEGAPAQFDTQSSLTISVAVGPLVITTTDLPPGAVNRSYSAAVVATGGTPPFTWSEPTSSFDAMGAGAAATACEGLTLSFTDGSITGIPTNEGTCGLFTIDVVDSSSPQKSDTQADLSIAINPEPAGRNDIVATATPLSNGTFLASISPYADPLSTANPDNDFYELTATVPADVVIEITAQGLVAPLGPSPLDSVIEIVSDDGSPLGSRFPPTCKDEGNFSGVDGTPDPTPDFFDDDCVNDDIELGVNRDSKLTFRVPGNPGDTVTFFVRVLDIRGDARPDFVYQITISGAN
jgi:hypothetical protein